MAISSRQLEYFRAVARELHFTRAAEALQIAQPALSQQIRKLERQLGVTLFERDNRRVELTEAGAALLAHAERVLSDLNAVEEEMRAWGQGTRGRLRLGIARGLIAWLPKLLVEFGAEYPGIELQLREMSTQEMVEELVGGRLDAATLARGPGLHDSRLTLRSLGTEPLLLTVGPKSSFAPDGEAAVADLAGLDLIIFPPGSVVRDVIIEALTDAGVEPRFRFETRDYGTARALVSAGLAAAFMPASVAAEPGPPIRTVRLDPEPVWERSLAWPHGRRPPPALAAFMAFLNDKKNISM